LAKTFKILKNLIPEVTVANVDANDHPLKKRLWDAFYGGELSCLKLKDNVTRALIDFCSKFPEMAAKAMSESNVKHGFVENRMIDKDMSKYPVLDKILATCKRNIPIDLYQKFIDNFQKVTSQSLCTMSSDFQGTSIRMEKKCCARQQYLKSG
jgi:hypothetical protein